MSLSPAIPAAPLVADVLFIAHGGPRKNGIALEFLDLDGNSLASTLTDPDALDAFGRQAMAVAAAARACDPAVVPIRQRPRARAALIGDPVPVRAFPAPALDPWRELDAEGRALAYMVVSIAALVLAVILVAWAVMA